MAYGNSAEWGGMSRRPHTVEFTVVYEVEGDERNVTLTVPAGHHPENVAHDFVSAWASAHCDKPVYHTGAFVIFPPSGVDIVNMKVKVTAGGVSVWTNLSSYDAHPDFTRVFDDDYLTVRNANI